MIVLATVLSVSGGPSSSPRTVRLLRHVDERLRARGHDMVPFDIRSLPQEAPLRADSVHSEPRPAAALFASADGVVVGAPVRKAARSGLLKAPLDLLPVVDASSAALGGAAREAAA